VIPHALWLVFSTVINGLLGLIPSLPLPAWLSSTHPCTGALTMGCEMYDFGQTLATVNGWLPVTELLDIVSLCFTAVLAVMVARFAIWLYGLVRGGGGN
jgi:hypothetical protein